LFMDESGESGTHTHTHTHTRLAHPFVHLFAGASFRAQSKCVVLFQ
jgi:hypothetical protein